MNRNLKLIVDNSFKKKENKFFFEKKELKNILGYEERPLVSTDFINDPRSSIIDSLSTMVVNDTQVKIYAWYDNEWGYANRLVDIVNMVVKTS